MDARPPAEVGVFSSASHCSQVPRDLGRPTHLCCAVLRVGDHILQVLHADVIALRMRGHLLSQSDIHPGVSSSAREMRSPERILWARATIDGVHLNPEFPEQFPDYSQHCLARRLWARIYLNDISSWSWVCTSAIIILEEAIRSGACPDESNTRELVGELRSLRDLLIVIDDEGRSTLLVPLAKSDAARQIICSLWAPDAEMILWRRLRNRMACVAATVTPSGANLGALVQHAAITCPQTMMQLSDEEQKKLEIIANKIVILTTEVDFETSLGQLATECEWLGQIVGMGCNFQAALPISLPRFPSPLYHGCKALSVNTPLWGPLILGVYTGQASGRETDGMDELHRLKKLRPHLNVLPMYQMANGGTIVGELLPHPAEGNLEDYLRKVPEANRRHLLQQAAAALAHIHAHSGCAPHVLSIKSVLISKDGTALLYDFGRFERVVDQIPLPAINPPYDATRQGSDPMYDAPERRNHEIRSRATDVFSFGMICFHTYLGAAPLRFPRDPEDISAAIARGERPSRDHITRTDFTDDMWTLVQRCWAQDPEDRPTMAEVERLLSEMDTPKERLAKECKTVTMTMRIFTPDDNALREYNEAQRKSEYVRETLEEMERQGLKKFISEVIEQNGCPRLTELLQEARAEKERYSRVRFL